MKKILTDLEKNSEHKNVHYFENNSQIHHEIERKHIANPEKVHENEKRKNDKMKTKQK